MVRVTEITSGIGCSGWSPGKRRGALLIRAARLGRFRVYRSGPGSAFASRHAADGNIPVRGLLVLALAWRALTLDLEPAWAQRMSAPGHRSDRYVRLRLRLDVTVQERTVCVAYMDRGRLVEFTRRDGTRCRVGVGGSRDELAAATTLTL